MENHTNDTAILQAAGSGSIDNEPTDFSLVLGGPLYQLYLRTCPVKLPLELLHRRIISFALITWVPLWLLTAARFYGPGRLGHPVYDLWWRGYSRTDYLRYWSLPSQSRFRRGGDQWGDSSRDSSTRVSIIVLAGAMALRQMGLANDIINLAFGLLLGAIALAVALAVGLGGREIASRELEGLIRSIKAKRAYGAEDGRFLTRFCRWLFDF